MAFAIIGLAVLFFLGHALNWLFIKTKIPDLLILVIMGYLAGPVFGVLKADDFGKVGPILSTMALVVILYEGGLHLSARDLCAQVFRLSRSPYSVFYLLHLVPSPSPF